jgi:hypothetical protein
MHGTASCESPLKHLGISTTPKKSTLAYANVNRPWELYESIFMQLLEKCQTETTAHSRRKFRFKNKLMSLDASIVGPSRRARQRCNNFARTPSSRARPTTVTQVFIRETTIRRNSDVNCFLVFSTCSPSIHCKVSRRKVSQFWGSVQSSFGWSLSNLAALLRQQLFIFRDLWAWLNTPLEGPPAARQLCEQLPMPLMW